MVDTAVEHRLAGLVWTRVKAGELDVPPSLHDRLEELDIQAWGRAQLLEAALAEILEVSRQLGVRVALFKGLATANRWYVRPNERWCYDLDLVMHPNDLGAVDELVSILYPPHVLSGNLVELFRGGHIQSVDFGVRNMPVDLHLDPLKLELIRSRLSVELWDHQEVLVLPSGLEVPTFDDDVSLFLHFVHLNKDSFKRLVGYADIVRGSARTSVDWQGMRRLAVEDGIEVSLLQTGAAVGSGLGVSIGPNQAPTSVRSWLWELAWPSDQRLRAGSDDPQRHRIFVMSLLAKGRLVETAGGWLRRLFPPKILLDFFYPSVTGFYLLKLVRARLRRRPTQVDPAT